ncbi:hypothetical protein SBA5_160023 [Candidatus Sulfotelmatomonas gaucii]|uniref:Uncharacterized protein n=1 Tax=Candidatus Sulfuritelmatomonas gaucii TaxID=2043161 RepID=A0A2N9L5M5_9BACT|nr:hypothetical protein SBA5_160023 [Candidatus Sulfotelmatomonas gaucii]
MLIALLEYCPADKGNHTLKRILRYFRLDRLYNCRNSARKLDAGSCFNRFPRFTLMEAL